MDRTTLNGYIIEPYHSSRLIFWTANLDRSKFGTEARIVPISVLRTQVCLVGLMCFVLMPIPFHRENRVRRWILIPICVSVDQINIYRMLILDVGVTSFVRQHLEDHTNPSFVLKECVLTPNQRVVCQRTLYVAWRGSAFFRYVIVFMIGLLQFLNKTCLSSGQICFQICFLDHSYHLDRRIR